MPDMIMDRRVINLTLLDAELRAALGDTFLGISTRAGVVVLHLAKTATGEHETQAKLLVQAHNAAALTPGQQAQKDRAERLQTDRSRFAVPLNPSDFAANPWAQTLAARIAWLEQELRDLRGL